MQESLNAAQEAQAQQLAQTIAQATSDDFLQIARTLVASGPSPFGNTEFTVRDLATASLPKPISNTSRKKNGYQGASVTCPHCPYAAPYQDDAAIRLVSLSGDVRYQRAYYYCRRCGQGFFPFDQQAGIPAHRLTPAAERLASLAGGVSDSFDKARQLLREMSGVPLSESTVERTTEDVGGRIAGCWTRA